MQKNCVWNVGEIDTWLLNILSPELFFFLFIWTRITVECPRIDWKTNTNFGLLCCLLFVVDSWHGFLLFLALDGLSIVQHGGDGLLLPLGVEAVDQTLKWKLFFLLLLLLPSSFFLLYQYFFPFQTFGKNKKNLFLLHFKKMFPFSVKKIITFCIHFCFCNSLKHG